MRSERGMSQQQLAAATGVSQSTIAKIEIGRNEATASTVRKFAAYFQVSADYILGLEDEFGSRARPGPDERDALEERQLLRVFRKLSPEMRATALKTIKLWAECPGDGR